MKEIMEPWMLDPDTPIYIQISDHFKNEIGSGRLSSGSRLPSVRHLAEHLGVSMTPVEWAYRQLVAEGFIESRPRVGYLASEIPQPYNASALPKISREEEAAHASRIRPEREYLYDFHLSRNDFSLFPLHTWRHLEARILKQEGERLLFYGDPQGEWGLRCEVAAYLKQYRGVVCSPEQVVIGSEQFLLMSCLAHILKPIEQHIAAENPVYPLLPGTFRELGFDVSPIPLDKDGISMSSLEASGARLVGVSPSHHFPSTLTMPIRRRMELLAWAERKGGYIIEDDYSGEFRYFGRPIPSLQGLGPERVVYIGGFSQTLAPAVCVHYLVLPLPLIERYKELYRRVLFEQSSSRLHQRTLEKFIAEGHLTKHIRKLRRIYKAKYEAIVQAAGQYFGDKAEVIGEGAGFHILLRVRCAHPVSRLIAAAEHAGVHVASTAYTWLDPSEKPEGIHEIIAGFAGIPLELIDPGVKALREAWDSLI
ncbi:HTH-type transcriptional regulatory protein GabR [compost metagenome]